MNNCELKRKRKELISELNLNDLLAELNAGNEVWELRYSSSNCKFHLAKMGLINFGYSNEEQDETYFPLFDMEE